jgi:hypothetical protein
MAFLLPVNARQSGLKPAEAHHLLFEAQALPDAVIAQVVEQGPPGDSEIQQLDDLAARRSLKLDPPVDVMPDYENQTQAVVW